MLNKNHKKMKYFNQHKKNKEHKKSLDIIDRYKKNPSQQNVMKD